MKRAATQARSLPALSVGVLPGLLALLGLGVACYGPTEVEVRVSTDLPCEATAKAGRPTSKIRTTIAVGASASEALVAADTTTCAPGAGGDNDVGSLVIVPSGARDAHVTVEVTTTTDGGPTEDCKPAPVGGAPGDCSKVPGNCTLPANCIVARRTFAFISHSSRALPIKLYARCAGKACGDEQTCSRTGECESALVQSCGSVASDCVPNPVDASAPGDGAVDAGGDGSVSPSICDVPAGNVRVTNTGTPSSELLAGNSTSLFWPVVSTGSGVVLHAVMTVPKQGAAAAAALVASSIPYTALAADDESLWAATAESVVRYDLLTKVQASPAKLSNVSAITITAQPGAPRKVYLATQPAGPGIVDTRLLVAVADPDPAKSWIPSVVGGAPGGIAMAASGTLLYLLDGADHLVRVAPPAAPQGKVLAQGSFDIAAFGGAAFMSSAGNGGNAVDTFSIVRVDDGMATPQLVTESVGLGRLAVDASFVYYLRHRVPAGPFGPGTAGVLRARKLKSDNDLQPVKAVAAGFEDVHGLVVDSACAYFLGAPALNAPLNLYVYPLDPSAAGASK